MADHGVDVLIVGAGMTGLTAGLALAEAGKSVLLVDKGRTVGGRLATRRIGKAVLDHGAQFFTVRSTEFGHAVRMWEDDGVVSVWTHGFDIEDPDGHPRYRTNGGMSKLAKHLAAAFVRAGGNLLVKHRVHSLIDTGQSITATYDAASRIPDDATAVLTTVPAPQCIQLLEAGGMPVPDPLRLITYNSVIALLVVTEIDPAHRLGEGGALQQPLDPMFTFIAENRTKGISEHIGLTFHTEPALSAALFDRPDQEIIERLTPELKRVLGGERWSEIQVKKWRYAGPRNGHPGPFLSVEGSSHPLLIAGDAFGDAKVEGAFLSGRRAAAALLTRGV